LKLSYYLKNKTQGFENLLEYIKNSTMNRINQNYKKLKNTFHLFSAGYPSLNDTVQIIEDLEKWVDMIEIGLPFSDPLADGPTIQESSTQALHNGMTTQVLLIN
jgi:tryptophan synthase alpha chain